LPFPSEALRIGSHLGCCKRVLLPDYRCMSQHVRDVEKDILYGNVEITWQVVWSTWTYLQEEKVAMP
jgi:hypothetical protein